MYKAKVNQSEFDIVLNENNEGTINGESFKLDLIKTGNNRFHIIRNNKSYTAELVSFDEEEKSYKSEWQCLYSCTKRQVRLVVTKHGHGCSSC